MLRYANWTRLATWSEKHDYQPEERGGSPVEKEPAFRMTEAASVGGLFHLAPMRDLALVAPADGSRKF
jgi:hypothetical protein